MDKAGFLSLIVGLVFCALGIYAIWIFLPEVIVMIKGLIGIAILLFGIMLVFFGILIAGD